MRYRLESLTASAYSPLMPYPFKTDRRSMGEPVRRLANGHILALASGFSEYPSEWVPELKGVASEYSSAPLVKPVSQPPRRGRWQSFAEPLIFAVALLAGVLAMSQWFSEGPTLLEAHTTQPKPAVTPH